MSHYGFDKLVDLFEAMPSTVRVLYPADGEWVVQLADSSNAQWKNDDEITDHFVVDVDEEDDDDGDGEGAVPKDGALEDTTSGPPPHVARVSKTSQSYLRQVDGEGVAVEGQSADGIPSEVAKVKNESNRSKTEIQNRRFATFKSLDFERLLSCR